MCRVRNFRESDACRELEERAAEAFAELRAVLAEASMLCPPPTGLEWSLIDYGERAGKLNMRERNEDD